MDQEGTSSASCSPSRSSRASASAIACRYSASTRYWAGCSNRKAHSHRVADGTLDPGAGDALGLGDLGGEGGAVVRVAGQGPGAEDELAARGHGVGGDDRD